MTTQESKYQVEQTASSPPVSLGIIPGLRPWIPFAQLACLMPSRFQSNANDYRGIDAPFLGLVPRRGLTRFTVAPFTPTQTGFTKRILVGEEGKFKKLDKNQPSFRIPFMGNGVTPGLVCLLADQPHQIQCIGLENLSKSQGKVKRRLCQ